MQSDPRWRICLQDVSGDGRHLLTGSYRDQASCESNFGGPNMGLVYFMENHHQKKDAILYPFQEMFLDVFGIPFWINPFISYLKQCGKGNLGERIRSKKHRKEGICEALHFSFSINWKCSMTSLTCPFHVGI